MPWCWLVVVLAACGESTVRDRVAGALELGGAALDVAAAEVRPEPCAALLGGAAALRGGAEAVRTHALPEVRLDLRRCGAVEAAPVDCEVRAWVPAAATWAGQLGGVLVDTVADPATPRTVAAVPVAVCP